MTRGDAYSLRNVARRIGVSPSYLSQVERGGPPPAEPRVIALADVLEVDRDVALAMAGHVSYELQEIIRIRPKLFSEVLKTLKDMPDEAILRIVSKVRDGEW